MKMPEYVKKELNTIIENHRHWLNEDCKGWEAMQANLQGADLRGANLQEADLRGANLWEANLQEANLWEANLQEADLYGANLYGANLYGANLQGVDLRATNLRIANLQGADLRGANLRGADLQGANLYGANLWEANLYGANLRGANLQEADLQGADLQGADLYGANLLRTKNIPEDIANQLMVCPKEGSFIGWKKVRSLSGSDYVIKLLIPEDAKRSSATTRKCRCSKAEVLDIQNLDGSDSGITRYENKTYDPTTVYEIGKITYPDSFDEDRWNECSHGIHFFSTRQEAVNYVVGLIRSGICTRQQQRQKPFSFI